MSNLLPVLITRLTDLTKAERAYWDKWTPNGFVYKFKDYRFTLDTRRNIDFPHELVITRNSDKLYRKNIADESISKLYYLVVDIYTKRSNAQIQRLIDELNTL